MGRSTMIEGDVFLYHQRKHHNRAIPLMSAPLKIADRITFKEWLREVAKLRKGLIFQFNSKQYFFFFHFFSFVLFQ